MTAAQVGQEELLFCFDQSPTTTFFENGPIITNTTTTTTTTTTTQEEQEQTSFVEAEWDPVTFDLTTKSTNNFPKWRNPKRREPKKFKRIQDIRLLLRLDSDGSSSSSTCGRGQQQTAEKEEGGGDDEYWPYGDNTDDGGSPCALFGKCEMTSSPAEGFEGEFSGGDPEWDNNTGELAKTSTSSSRSGSRRKSSGVSSHRERSSRSERSGGTSSDKNNNSSSSSNNRRTSSSRRQIQKPQPQPQEEDDVDDDEHDAGSDADNNSDSDNDDDDDYRGSGEESEESDEQYSESERSATDSPNGEDDNLMVTPAMGKGRDTRKKPPTLKRGAHQVATPSVVKALGGKNAFASDDEGDNGNVDFDAADFDSDLESAGSSHSRSSTNRSSSGRRGSSSKDRNGASAKATAREGRLEAANQIRAKKASKFALDRAMSSADLKAARRANNSFKGQVDMTKSFSALQSKQRAQRRNKREEMQNSFGSSLPVSKSSPPGERKVPLRAKSMGNPSASGSKLKSALSKFAGTTTTESTTTATAKPKTFGSTLSALKALSGGGDAGTSGGESDLKAAIMQQVHRSSSVLAPVEMKRKPKPKITKQSSLSEAVGATGGDVLKDLAPTARLRRTKTSSDKTSLSDLNASNSNYHDSISKMRKQKMVDASVRSANSAESALTAATASSQESSNKDNARQRPSNLDRKAKSFSQPRSGTTLDVSDASNSVNVTPKKSPAGRPRLSRGGSKRLTKEDDLGGEGSQHSRRGLQKSGSRRRIQQRPEYDATPQKPSGTNVIALLKQQEPVTDKELMQKGNRQMFHALMYKTRMGIDMDRIRRKVEGLEESSESAAAADDYESEDSRSDSE